MQRNLYIVLFLALALTTGSAAPMVAAQEEAAEQVVTVLVQAADADAAARAVATLGGELTHRLEVIGAVGAKMSPAAAVALKELDGFRVFQDRQLGVDGRRGNRRNGERRNRGRRGRRNGGDQEPTDYPSWYQPDDYDDDSEARDTLYPKLVGARAAHRRGAIGSGVTVAVVDTGLWTDGRQSRWLVKNTRGHDRLLATYDAINDVIGGSVEDGHGHGTHVTSILASSRKSRSRQNRGRTYNGIAPDADLVIVKAFDDLGQGRYLDVIRAIDFVVNHKDAYGIRVLNLSFSAPPRSHYWDDPLNQAVMAAWQAGIVVVASAGNRGPEPMTIGVPGNVPYVITVGAMSDAVTPTDQNDDFLTSFSSAGPTFEGFVKPEVLAPGGHMLALIDTESYLATLFAKWRAGDAYFWMSGTSQSAAVASGAAAVLLGLEPWLEPDDTKCRLMDSARPAVSETGELAYSIFQQGAGMVHVRRALRSYSEGCANRGLDIDLDLAGVQHYAGRASLDRDGKPYVTGLDGFLWADGFVWADGLTWADAFVWSDGLVWADGMVWADGLVWADAFVWSDGLLWADGMLWADGGMSIGHWVEQE